MRKLKNKLNKKNANVNISTPVEDLNINTPAPVDYAPATVSPTPGNIDFVKITKVKDMIENMELDIHTNESTIFKHPPLKAGYNVLRTARLASSEGAKFGMTRRKKDGTPRPHQGIDLAVPPGYRCYAVANGIVRSVNKVNDNGYGLSVTIKISENLFVFYAHLSSIFVKVGEKVKAGDIIGLTGYSGNAKNMQTMETGSHLHFEVRTTAAPGLGLENRLDPLNYITLDTYNASLYA